VAPASFSRQAAGASLKLSDLSSTVSGADLAEDAGRRARRLQRPGAVAPASASPKKSTAGKVGTQNSKHNAGKGSPEHPKPVEPWWVQNSKEIYKSQKLLHHKDMKVKEDAHAEAVEAHALHMKQREEAAAERRAVRMANSMPLKIDKVVVVSKMRDRDIERDIAELDRRLKVAASKRHHDKDTLKKAAELIRLKEEELVLTRERMVHLYRSASEAIIGQSQQLTGADTDLAAYLDRKGKGKGADSPLVTEMVTHNDIRRACELYDRFSRIEVLWARLREFAFTVGKVELRRRRAAAMQSIKQRQQYNQAVTDSIYSNAIDFGLYGAEAGGEAGPKTPGSGSKPASAPAQAPGGSSPAAPKLRKGFSASSPVPTMRRGSTLATPSGGARKTMGPNGPSIASGGPSFSIASGGPSFARARERAGSEASQHSVSTSETSPSLPPPPASSQTPLPPRPRPPPPPGPPR
jgi:hypothetical protein